MWRQFASIYIHANELYGYDVTWSVGCTCGSHLPFPYLPISILQSEWTSAAVHTRRTVSRFFSAQARQLSLLAQGAQDLFNAAEHLSLRGVGDGGDGGDGWTSGRSSV